MEVASTGAGSGENALEPDVAEFSKALSSLLQLRNLAVHWHERSAGVCIPCNPEGQIYPVILQSPCDTNSTNW
jgi:hypothetical protein